MARVEFKKKSGHQALHGTFGGMTYRTRRGRVFAYNQRIGEEFRSQVIALAVAEIQILMYNRGAPTVQNMQAQMDKYSLIKKTVTNWYEAYHRKIRDRELLIKALVFGYINKFDAPELAVRLHGKV